MLFTAFSKEAADTFVAIYGVVSHPPKLPDGRTERGFGIFFFCHFLPRMIMQPPEAGARTLFLVYVVNTHVALKRKKGGKTRGCCIRRPPARALLFPLPRLHFSVLSVLVASPPPPHFILLLFLQTLKSQVCCLLSISSLAPSSFLFGNSIIYSMCVCVTAWHTLRERYLSYPQILKREEERQIESVSPSFVRSLFSLSPSFFLPFVILSRNSCSNL